MPTYSMQNIDTAARKAFVASPAGRTALQSTVDDSAIMPWLANLVLLKGVPFQHLVPAAAMLPQESIRFFQVDPNWIDCAIDGAMSIAIASSADRTQQDAVIAQIRADARTAANLPAGQTAMSGFLLRSSLVTEMPDMVITAADGSGTALTALSLTQPSPGLLFALYPGTLATVTLAQPQTGLIFGVEDDLAAPKTRMGVQMRALTGAAPGQAIPGAMQPLDAYLSPSRVISMATLAGDLQTALRANGGLPANGTLGPAGFAVQMIAAPESQSFTVTWPTT